MHLASDLAYGLRQLARRPGFTLVAVATLALGIGAVAGIFSFVKGLLLDPLPYPDDERLVVVWQDFRGRGGPEREWFSYPNFLDYRAQSRTLEDLAVWGDRPFTLAGGDRPERVAGALVSHSFFDVLGVEPARGRGIAEADDRPGAARVALLTDAAWRRRFGADPDVVGRTLALDGEPVTVAGVLPEGFSFPFVPDAELYLPLRLDPERSGRGSVFLRTVGRLAPGVGLEEARAELAALAADLERGYPDANTGVGAAVYPLGAEMVRPVRAPLLALLGAVALLLLVACANVAHLQLARATSRGGELAVRTALGASRGRLVRQLLTESALLGLVGGLTGAGVAVLLADGLRSLVPAGFAVPRLEEVSVDAGVLALTFGLALAAGLAFGALPAFASGRRDPASELRGTGSGEAGRGSGHLLRAGLVVAETALALVLVVGAGLLVKSFLGLAGTDPGFEARGVLGFTVATPPSSYPESEQVAELHRRLAERLEALPGVESAGATSSPPLASSNSDTSFRVEGRPAPEPGEEPTAWYRATTPGYFATLRLPLLAGRLIGERDAAGAPEAIVVNESFAETYFPGEEALGRRILLGSELSATIVGVVGDTRSFGLDRDEPPAFYSSHPQFPTRRMGYVLRTSRDPAALVPEVRRVVAELDPELAVAAVEPLAETVATSLAPERATAWLTGVFGLVSLLLAAVGLYGVVAYSAAERTREIGIRMALGAHRRDVLGLVLRRGLAMVGLGLAAGLAGAAGLTGLLEALLHGVEPLDPAVLAAASLLLAAVASLAAWLPARRAARLDPVRALRG